MGLVRAAKEMANCEPNADELLRKYFYYECYQCRQPYFGGLAECQVAGAEINEPRPESVLCHGCMVQSTGRECETHGAEFMAIKCDFCCNEALFRCGTIMYCNPCHSPPTNVAKPCDPSICPLRGQHP